MKMKKTKSGLELPAIGLGTYQIGGGEISDRSRDREALDMLKRAFDIGYRHLDTAEVYGGGHSEELIGQALSDYDRKDFFITTKVSASHLKADQVHRALEGSLDRLRTDYVDLYLIHWPDESIPLEETMDAMNETVRKGLCRNIGVSNFVLDLLKRANELSEKPLLSDQVPYSIERKDYAVNGVLEYCQKEGILLTAYSPIKNAFLNKQEIRDIAGHHDATPAQIALAWLVMQENVITIPKSSNPEHLEQNFRAADIELSDEEMNILGKL